MPEIARFPGQKPSVVLTTTGIDTQIVTVNVR